MRHFRPLKAEEEKALASLAQANDPMREALQKEIYELEHTRVPVYRLALERVLFRQLVAAARISPYKSRAVQKVLERIPHMSARLEWERLAPEERHDRMLDALPADLEKTT